MQSSHLSFQEYYTAKSLADGRKLPPTVMSPWRWSSWWKNVLRLGAELGDRFGRGLLEAVGEHVASLELKGKIGGDLPTAMLAVAQLMRATHAVGLSANRLGADEILPVAEGLRVTTCLTELDLSANRLCGVWFEKGDFRGEFTVKGIVALSEALKGSPCLTKLDLSQNSLGVSYVAGQRVSSMEGVVALAEAISKSQSLKKLSIAYNGIGPMAGKAIGDACGSNPRLTELDIGGNLIGIKGGKAIAEAITANPSLTCCDLRFNSLDEGTRRLCQQMAGGRCTVIF